MSSEFHHANGSASRASSVVADKTDSHQDQCSDAQLKIGSSSSSSSSSIVVVLCRLFVLLFVTSSLWSLRPALSSATGGFTTS